MIVWPVEGDGVLNRLLARELCCSNLAAISSMLNHR
jgi:hypothetical protein